LPQINGVDKKRYPADVPFGIRTTWILPFLRIQGFELWSCDQHDYSSNFMNTQKIR